MFLSVINPTTEREIGQIEIDTEETIQKKWANAQNALPRLKKMPFTDRVQIIRKFQKGLHNKKEELATILSNEMGKPISQSRAEIEGLIERIDFFIDSIKNELKTRFIEQSGRVKEYVTYEPLGVIANISAWNYPYFVGGNVFIPAILTGNCVLYKPSEFASLTGQQITAIFSESGLLEGAFQAIYGEAEIANQLLNLPIDGFFFTGSSLTGQKICIKMRNRMIPIQLELGGKDPAYVDNNVDLPFVSDSLAGGVFYNNGQSCCAVERIYVHQGIYHQFLDAFIKIVKSYKVGDPLCEENFLGPLARPQQVHFIEEQINDATSRGAKIILGGASIKREGYFFEPTILSNVNHDMDVMRNESFGPVIGIQSVKDENEAMVLMKDTNYGLTSAVYSKDKAIAEKILHSLSTGSVYWNTCDRVSPHLPWSGRKNSGMGVTLGLEGIRSFLKPKAWHMADA